MHARSTATYAIKNNIKITECMTEPNITTNEQKVNRSFSFFFATFNRELLFTVFRQMRSSCDTCNTGVWSGSRILDDSTLSLLSDNWRSVYLLAERTADQNPFLIVRKTVKLFFLYRAKRSVQLLHALA